MSDNKQTVRRIFDEVVNHGKIEVVDDLFDADFQGCSPQRTLDRDAFKDYVRMWGPEGDKVAWSIRATGTHTGEFMGIPPTGNTVDFDSLNLAEFRDGRGYRHTVMMDLAKMMQQLGVTS